VALTIYREDDADPAVLQKGRVAIIGYGNQGRAHALNLRDSGVVVVVGQRPGRSSDRAKADGFEPKAVWEATAVADLVILTLPDESAASVFDNIHFGFIKPPSDVDVVMIAPKGPGALLRSLYVEGKGLPALLAIHQDATGRAIKTALAWAAAIGSTRAGVIETTFATETETDLFGEQVVLCGGMTALTKAAFETLVEAGYEPEFAYLECVHELKQVVDLLYERGLTGMRDAVSNTAQYGDLTRGPRVITDATRQEMKRILDEIRSGAFAKEWINEYRTGGKNFKRLHNADADSLMERAGRNVRDLMPWLANE